MKTSVEGKTEKLSGILLEWYDANKRDLPWREDPSPYHVWISEIMLQQTRVEAVRDYYTRFLEALPTIRDLAEADEDLCTKLWQGLGYYSRVRNLRRAAMQIMEDHNGNMPRTSAELRKLAGIGPYTAADRRKGLSERLSFAVRCRGKDPSTDIPAESGCEVFRIRFP